MLKNFYDIDTSNFKCNEKYQKYNFHHIQTTFDVFHSLNDFINDYKQYYCNNRDKKININNNEFYPFTFNDIFSDFIDVYLYEWKIGKYENVSIYKYDDYVVIYTKNNTFSYVFDD